MKSNRVSSFLNTHYNEIVGNKITSNAIVFNTLDVNTFTVIAKYLCCLVVKHYNITTMKS